MVNGDRAACYSQNIARGLRRARKRILQEIVNDYLDQADQSLVIDSIDVNDKEESQDGMEVYYPSGIITLPNGDKVKPLSRAQSDIIAGKFTRLRKPHKTISPLSPSVNTPPQKELVEKSDKDERRSTERVRKRTILKNKAHSLKKIIPKKKNNKNE